MTGNGAGTIGITGATCCRIIYRRSNENSMKKIGILFGQENSFPWAFIDRVNQKTGGGGIVAETGPIDKKIQSEPRGPDPLINRISHGVAVYPALFKKTPPTRSALVHNTLLW